MPSQPSKQANSANTGAGLDALSAAIVQAIEGGFASVAGQFVASGGGTDSGGGSGAPPSGGGRSHSPVEEPASHGHKAEGEGEGGSETKFRGVKKDGWGGYFQALKSGLFEEENAFAIGYPLLETGTALGKRYNELNSGQYVTPEEREASLTEAVAPGLGGIAGALIGGAAGPGGAVLGSFAGNAGGEIVSSVVDAKDKRDEATRETAERLAAALGQAEAAVTTFRTQIEATGAPVAQLGQGLSALMATAPGVGSQAIAGAGRMALAEGTDFVGNTQTLGKFLSSDPALAGAAAEYAQHGSDISADSDRSIARLGLLENNMPVYQAAKEAAAAKGYSDDPEWNKRNNALKAQESSWIGKVDHFSHGLDDAILPHFGISTARVDAIDADPVADAQKALEQRQEAIEKGRKSEDDDDAAVALARGKAKSDLSISTIETTTAENRFRASGYSGASAADQAALLPQIRAALNAGARADDVVIDQDKAEMAKPGFDKNLAPAYNTEIATAEADKSDRQVVRFQEYQRQAFEASFDEHNAHYSLTVLRAQIEGKSATDIAALQTRQAAYLEGVANNPIVPAVDHPARSRAAAVAEAPTAAPPAADSSPAPAADTDPELARLQGVKTAADQAQTNYLRGHLNSGTDEATLKTLHAGQVAAAAALDAYQNTPEKRAAREIAAARARGHAAGDDGGSQADATEPGAPMRLSPTERDKTLVEALQLRYQAQQNVFTETLTHDDNVIGQADYGVTKARGFGSSEDVAKAQGAEIDSFKAKIAELGEELKRGGQTVADYARESRELTQTQQQSTALTAQRRDEQIQNTASMDSSQLAIDTAGIERTVAIGGSAAYPVDKLDTDTAATLAHDQAAIDSLPANSPARKTAEEKRAQDAAAGRDRDDSATFYSDTADDQIAQITQSSKEAHASHVYNRSRNELYLDGEINSDPLLRGNDLIQTYKGGIAQDEAQEARETADRTRLQGKNGADGKPLWSALSEKAYQSSQARLTESIDQRQDRVSDLEHERMENFLGAVPEFIEGSAGLSSGLRSAITTTSAAAALYEPNSIFGRFGDSNGGRSRPQAQVEAAHPHYTPSATADDRDAAGHPHSRITGATSNAPHSAATDMATGKMATLADVVRAIQALQHTVSRSSSVGPMSPQAAVRANEQYQATTGRH